MEEKLGIKVKSLYKTFGSTEVLHDVNLECKKGEITGIVGRNGSGKTVLFKCICGLLLINKGEIWIDGRIRKANEAITDIGVIIEEPAFLKNYSAIKNLQFLFNINNKSDNRYLESIIAKVGLDSKSKKHISKYSMGMKQRLAIAQVIMEKPNILILDEPFNGLDNEGVEEMRKLFLNLKDEGKTILVASHNAEDIKVLCDRVFEMNKGKLEKL